MKKILITGKDSYIGTSFEKWVAQWPEKYDATTIDVTNDDWKNMDFSSYDSILHVAAIVHQKEKPEMKALYRKVNCELPISIAKKAKDESVQQFIFISSMSVYGMKEGIIYKETIPIPNTYYGKSKLEAENRLKKLDCEQFKIAIVRPPMVYGKKCKGNYARLSRFALKMPFFPNIKNYRSMISINNLAESIKLLIDKETSGFYFPQNKNYVSTSNLIKTIRKEHGKKTKYFNGLNKVIYFSTKKNKLASKIFGNLVYDLKLSRYCNFLYCIENFEESIRKAENI